MLKVVVDTNLIVSGTATTSTVPYHLLESWRNNEYILLTSPPILEEVKDVLNRPHKGFTITPEQIKSFIYTLSTRTIVTPGTLEVDVIPNDPDDNKFIACAIEGSASHIVTGDQKHLLPLKECRGIQIVSARRFLEDFLQKKIT